MMTKSLSTTVSIDLPHKGCIAIVASSWHKAIIDKLVEGAARVFKTHAPSTWSYELFWVPGAYELPQTCQKIAKTKCFQGIVPLGCLIKGETSHFEWICQSVFLGLDQVARKTGIPISNGVLTVQSEAQAHERAGGFIE
ncbi:MAG: 6,7-dimethyl-8-ribityllumazine synthase, partial [Bdellovibrionales bacterium]|nr:6,7-dimethyl-8-ribityllumazine synthase [Bdellovibrionales bacterium]